MKWALPAAAASLVPDISTNHLRDSSDSPSAADVTTMQLWHRALALHTFSSDSLRNSSRKTSPPKFFSLISLTGGRKKNRKKREKKGRKEVFNCCLFAALQHKYWLHDATERWNVSHRYTLPKMHPLLEQAVNYIHWLWGLQMILLKQYLLIPLIIKQHFCIKHCEGRMSQSIKLQTSCRKTSKRKDISMLSCAATSFWHSLRSKEMVMSQFIGWSLDKNLKLRFLRMRTATPSCEDLFGHSLWKWLKACAFYFSNK